MTNQSQGLPPLDDAVVSDQEIEDEALRYESSQGLVYDRLRKENLPIQDIHTSPARRPPFPHLDLRELQQRNDANAYSEVYDDLLLWKGELLILVCEAKNNRMAYEESLRNTKDLVRKGLLPAYKAKLITSQEELNLRVDTHPEVRRIRPELLTARQLEAMFDSYLSRIDSMISGVSRHITLRGQDNYLNGNPTQRTQRPGAPPPPRPYRTDDGGEAETQEAPSKTPAPRQRSPHRWPG